MYGAELKNAREAAGLTTQQLADTTRIHRTVIEKIEREETGRLPEPVFVRGYIQQLAKALGIPAERAKSWIEDYIAQSGDLPPHRRHPETEPNTKRKPANTGVIVGAILAIAVLASVFVFWPKSKKAGSPEPKPRESAVTAPEPVVEPASAPETRPKTEPETAAPVAPTPDVAIPLTQPDPVKVPEPEKPVEAPPKPVPPAVVEVVLPAPAQPPPKPLPDKPPVEPPATEPVPAVALPPVDLQPPPLESDIPEVRREQEEKLKLAVKATEETWLTWQADGSPVQETLLLGGETFNIEAERKIWLKSGNAGGLQMTLNGHKLAPIGPRGKVRTVTYDQDTLRSLTETD